MLICLIRIHNYWLLKFNIILVLSLIFVGACCLSPIRLLVLFINLILNRNSYWALIEHLLGKHNFLKTLLIISDCGLSCVLTIAVGQISVCFLLKILINILLISIKIGIAFIILYNLNLVFFLWQKIWRQIIPFFKKSIQKRGFSLRFWVFIIAFFWHKWEVSLFFTNKGRAFGPILILEWISFYYLRFVHLNFNLCLLELVLQRAKILKWKGLLVFVLLFALNLVFVL